MQDSPWNDAKMSSIFYSGMLLPLIISSFPVHMFRECALSISNTSSQISP